MRARVGGLDVAPRTARLRMVQDIGDGDGLFGKGLMLSYIKSYFFMYYFLLFLDSLQVVTAKIRYLENKQMLS